MKLGNNFYLTFLSVLFLIISVHCHKSKYRHRSRKYSVNGHHSLANFLHEQATEGLLYGGGPVKSPKVKKPADPPISKKAPKALKTPKHPITSRPHKKKPKVPKKTVKKKAARKDKKSSSDTVTYERVLKYIREYATTSSSQSNVNKKKKLAGALGPSYPKALRAKAKRQHYNKKTWNKIMLYPAKVFKFCIYPFYELNYSKWCEEKYSSDLKKKINCQHTMCAVCCDNLQIMYRNQADNNVLGDLLKLSKTSGFAKIQSAATKEDIKLCRDQCQIRYPVQFPKAKLPVPRDPLLGKFSTTPATSCMDIKRWGPADADSNSYWIRLPKKGVTQVYCDMYSMQGGWTLFFNYMKFPNKKVRIKKGRLPNNLKTNSHINLNEGGFNEEQVKEIRFFCTEKSTKKFFWHWRTDSPTTISTAFNGDQTKMKLKEFKDEYSEMIFPGRALLWTRAMGQQQMEEEFDYLGKSKNGGFWDRPFGSTTLKKYWTVRGAKKEPVWECGTHHNNASESNSAYTHHTVWFRGDPPNEDFARVRYYSKEIIKLRKKIVKMKNAGKRQK